MPARITKTGGEVIEITLVEGWTIAEGFLIVHEPDKKERAIKTDLIESYEIKYD